MLPARGVLLWIGLSYIGLSYGNFPPAEPPEPPYAPNPSPAPSRPPLPPGYASSSITLCENICVDESGNDWANDGACDDGGPGSDFSDCRAGLGYDCGDCGPRQSDALRLCTSCPIECNQLGNASRFPRDMCLESMYNEMASVDLENPFAVQPTCHRQCNNWQCLHDGGDCTLAQALDVCRPIQKRRANLLKTIPPNSTTARAPVEFSVSSMKPFRPTLDSAANEWKLELEMTISLRWADSRLVSVPCRRKLGDMLSLAPGTAAAVREAQESDRSIIWMPTPKINDSAITYRADPSNVAPGSIKNEVSAATFTFTPGVTTPWIGGGPAGSTHCVDCAQQTLSFTWAIGVEPLLKFDFFPFDHQQFTIRFDLGEQVDAFSCEHLLSDTSSLFATLKAEGNLDSLLPTTNEYFWNTGAPEPFSAHHPKGDGGAVEKGKCDITFKVKRDTSIIFLKVIIPTIIVVYLGLLGVLLRAEDFAGDRAALLGVSLLINMVNIERDNGIGKLAYSVWFDTFNLSQIIIIVIAVIEGLIEYRLHIAGKELECLILQSVWSWLLLVGFYPLMTAAIILGGANEPEGALACWILMGICFFIALCVGYYRTKIGRVRRKQALKRLFDADTRDPEDFMHHFTAAFEAFDELGAGVLHIDVARELFKAAMNRDYDGDGQVTGLELFSNSMDEARKVATATGGKLSIEACEDLFAKLGVTKPGGSIRGGDTDTVATKNGGPSSRRFSKPETVVPVTPRGSISTAEETEIQSMKTE